VGEIRSTIDIMMERTRGMTLSEEERERLQREESVKRAKGLRLKLMTDPSRANEVLAAIEKESATEHPMLDSLFWSDMVENIPEDKELLPYLDLLESLPQARGKQSILRKIRDSWKACTKETSADKKDQAARERKRLADVGISGGAVVPRLLEGGFTLSRFSDDLKVLKKALVEQ
jgi:hypothetical protein